MRKFLRKIYKYWGNLMAYGLHLYYNKWCNKIMKLQNIPNNKIDGEEEYTKKWKQLSSNVNPLYYRIFSQYIKPDANIVPEDICHNIIEHILNPAKHRIFYADKNMYDKIFPAGTLPATIIRCIQGHIYDSVYKNIEKNEIETILNNISYESIIIKPTVDSDSGHGVLLYKKGKNNLFYNSKDNSPLTYEALKNIGKDWIIQECMEQSSYMSMFNKTSVNTLRVLVYRSPIDNKARVLNSILRIGKKGSYIDNAHAGGVFVGINKDGSFGHFLCDQFGNKYNEFNDFNFKNNKYQIPNFEHIKKFAESIAERVIHLRLLALDIMIDKNGKPTLIEFNVYALGTWPFQFTTSSVFGECTDEIIAYCKDRKSEIERVRVSVW